MFLVLILILLSWATYFLVIKPLIPLIQMKLQFGSAATLDYFPLIGDLYRFKQSEKKFNDPFYHFRYFNANVQTYKKFRLTNLMDQPVIGINDPEYYKSVFVDHYNYEKFDVVGHDQLIKNGLIYTNGEKWKKQRNSFGNSFHHEMLKSRIPMINKVVDYQLAQDKEKTHILTLMSKITGNVVVNSFFSDDVEGVELNGKPIYVEIVEIFNDVAKLQSNSPIILIKQLLFKQKSWTIFPTKDEIEVCQRIRDLRFLCEKIIQKRIVRHSIKQDEKGEDVKINNDFLDVQIKSFLEQQNTKDKITIDEIIQQFITLAFAGTDTTATLSALTLIFMITHPNDQEEIYQEVINIRKEGDFSDDDLKQMVKLSAFINEVLRIRNPALFPITRRALRDHQIKDLKIKKGWWVNIDNFGPQLSEKYYDNAEEFDYKRWLNKDPIKNNNQFVFVPFSAGGRNCIGQHMALIEAKIILAKVIRQYKPIFTPKTKLYWANLFLYSFGPENAVTLVPRQ